MSHQIQNDEALTEAAHILDHFHQVLVRQVMGHADGQGYVTSGQRIAHGICLYDRNAGVECAGHPHVNTHRLNSDLALNLKQ